MATVDPVTMTNGHPIDPISDEKYSGGELSGDVKEEAPKGAPEEPAVAADELPSLPREDPAAERRRKEEEEKEAERAENARIAALIEAAQKAQEEAPKAEPEPVEATPAPAPSSVVPSSDPVYVPIIKSAASSNRHSMFVRTTSISTFSRSGSISVSRGGLNSASSAASLVPSPANRSAASGPVVPISAITGAVRATNPILDELLHAIQLLNADDPTLTTLDLKDCKVFTAVHGAALAEGLAKNTHLKELILENTKLQTATAIDLANALRFNNTLEVLNLESNFIAPQGIKALAECLEHNHGLRELKLVNQKSPSGTDAEQSFAKALGKNQTLTKLGLLFRDVASRNSVDRAITRNKEIARKARLAAK
ncbi:hypothetical protein DFJ73DRAFT_320648 [Zopfochytrium polystomum]|nr:hypothetical protein DFJ73DRAFT_320648 [Zopfochytrium polystomum]